MTSEELLQKVRKIEIKTRGLSRNIFAGEYHSQFKGRGMAFSEVREYQPGDDVRAIDWNVTARMNRPYVKIYVGRGVRTASRHPFSVFASKLTRRHGTW